MFWFTWTSVRSGDELSGVGSGVGGGEFIGRVDEPGVNSGDEGIVDDVAPGEASAI